MAPQTDYIERLAACPEVMEVGVRYHDCDRFGIIRRKRGRGFEYFLLSGEKIRDIEQIKYFKSLVIPPMWRDVHVSLCPYSKVQAFGYDQRNRKQYIYHQAWEEYSQHKKFARLTKFARQLPALRARCYQDLKHSDWTQEKSTALALVLLDHTGIRIGNRSYCAENSTYGLTTLRRKHIANLDDGLSFCFTGKHGKAREVNIDDDEVCRLVEDAASQPGYPVFRYFSEGRWQDLISDDVNARLREVLSEDFSCKDFRTWAGTRLAMQKAVQAEQLVLENSRREFLPTLVKLVAAELGNTPSVCEKYYIHPAVLQHLSDAAERGSPMAEFPPSESWLSAELDASEQAALGVIEKAKAA